MEKIKFTMKPAQTAGLDTEVGAAWTIHVADGFDTQIGTRLEHRRKPSGVDYYRMVFKDDKNVTIDTERDAMVLIQGILLGRTLC